MNPYGDYSRYYGAVNYRGAEGTWDAVTIARSTAAYITEEAGLPSLFGQFSMGRSFNWVAGISSIVGARAREKCCTGWESLLGLPNPQFILQWTKDAQAAAIEGITSTVGSGPAVLLARPPGQTAHKMMYWYADVITDREESWARVIEKLQAGLLPLTPAEEEAQVLLEKWVRMCIAGGKQKSDALKEAGVHVSGGNVLIQIDTDRFPLTMPEKLDTSWWGLGAKKYEPVLIKSASPYFDPTAMYTPFSLGFGGLAGLAGLGATENNEKTRVPPLLVIVATGTVVYLMRDRIKPFFTRTR